MVREFHDFRKQNASRLNDDADNPWSQYRRLVLKGLETLDEDIDKLDRSTDASIKALTSQLNALEVKVAKDIASLQAKAGLIGAIAGSLLSGIIAIIAHFVK